MSDADDLGKLPLPKSWPKLAKRALVLVNSMLKVSFDILCRHHKSLVHNTQRCRTGHVYR